MDVGFVCPAAAREALVGDKEDLAANVSEPDDADLPSEESGDCGKMVLLADISSVPLGIAGPATSVFGGAAGSLNV